MPPHPAQRPPSPHGRGAGGAGGEGSCHSSYCGKRGALVATMNALSAFIVGFPVPELPKPLLE